MKAKSILLTLVKESTNLEMIGSIQVPEEGYRDFLTDKAVIVFLSARDNYDAMTHCLKCVHGRSVTIELIYEDVARRKQFAVFVERDVFRLYQFDFVGILLCQTFEER